MKIGSCDLPNSLPLSGVGSEKTPGVGGSKTPVSGEVQSRHTDTVELKISAGKNDHLYSMSELKKKADERLRKDGDPASSPAPLSETDTAAREERVQLAKLRMNAGFYSRPDVIEEIARKISDKLEP